jgi:hypothetical protein
MKRTRKIGCYFLLGEAFVFLGGPSIGRQSQEKGRGKRSAKIWCRTVHVEVVALACFNPVWGSLGVREERGEERRGE